MNHPMQTVALSHLFHSLFHHPKAVEVPYNDSHDYSQVPFDAVAIIKAANNPLKMDLIPTRVLGKVRTKYFHITSMVYLTHTPQAEGLTPLEADFKLREINPMYAGAYPSELTDTDVLFKEVVHMWLTWLEANPAPEPEANTYLGEYPVELDASPFRSLDQKELAIYFMGRYSQLTGAEHKAWVLDQVARILHGGQIADLRKVVWTKGDPEYRFTISESPEYQRWLSALLKKYPNYNCGLAPF